MEGTRWEVAMDLNLNPVLVSHLMGPLGLSGPIADVSWTHSYSKQSTASECPPSSTTPIPLPPTHPCPLMPFMILQSCEKVVQNPTVITSKQK